MSNTVLLLALVQLIQITALVLLVALLVRFTARNRPHLAHLLWLLVVIKCLTPPLWSSDVGLFSWLQSEAMATETVSSQRLAGRHRFRTAHGPAAMALLFTQDPEWCDRS